MDGPGAHFTLTGMMNKYNKYLFSKENCHFFKFFWKLKCFLYLMQNDDLIIKTCLNEIEEFSHHCQVCDRNINNQLEPGISTEWKMKRKKDKAPTSTTAVDNDDDNLFPTFDVNSIDDDILSMDINLVFYHGGCPDGFLSAYALYRGLPKSHPVFNSSSHRIRFIGLSHTGVANLKNQLTRIISDDDDHTAADLLIENKNIVSDD
jgi:hypothetical protein